MHEWCDYKTMHLRLYIMPQIALQVRRSVSLCISHLCSKQYDYNLDLTSSPMAFDFVGSHQCLLPLMQSTESLPWSEHDMRSLASSKTAAAVLADKDHAQFSLHSAIRYMNTSIACHISYHRILHHKNINCISSSVRQCIHS